MSNPTGPSIARQILNTIKVGIVVAGIVGGLAIGQQAATTRLMAEDTRVPATTAAPSGTAAEPAEDDPAFDCRIHGDNVCGPTGGHDAGCYTAGVLVQPWRDDMRGLGRAGCATQV